MKCKVFQTVTLFSWIRRKMAISIANFRWIWKKQKNVAIFILNLKNRQKLAMFMPFFVEFQIMRKSGIFYAIFRRIQRILIIFLRIIFFFIATFWCSKSGNDFCVLKQKGIEPSCECMQHQRLQPLYHGSNDYGRLKIILTWLLPFFCFWLRESRMKGTVLDQHITKLFRCFCGTSVGGVGVAYMHQKVRFLFAAKHKNHCHFSNIKKWQWKKIAK